ncbi:MAG: pseudaminic acid cytidylyltransferase [Gemmatimonadaceae bacterium]|nr:pseudaminic acid cytidylyltransferase [Gemmatimonadaceae bacterium]
MSESPVTIVIPARGGSKRIPRKNIKPFLGVPLLARTIALLRELPLAARILVSTDDDEIADIAKTAGAEVPFRRPADLANDEASTVPVIRHAVEYLQHEGQAVEVVCAVYPAAVLLDPPLLVEAIATLERDPDLDYVLPVTTFGSPIQRALRRTPQQRMVMFQPEHYESRSQELEPAYHDAGQFYVGRASSWLSERPLFGARSGSVLVPRWRVQDIDTPEDWVRAEQIATLLQRDGQP